MAKNAQKTNALGTKLSPENFLKRESENRQNQTTEVVTETAENKHLDEDAVIGKNEQSVTPEPKKEQGTTNNAPETKEKGNLAAVYAEKVVIPKENRTVRMQVVVTPTTNKRLNEMIEKRVIRSKNDLINFLLEQYLDMVDENK